MQKRNLVLLKNLEQILSHDANQSVFLTVERELYYLYRDHFKIYYIESFSFDNVINFVKFLESKNIIVNSCVSYIDSNVDFNNDQDILIKSLRKEIYNKDVKLKRLNALIEEKNRIIVSYQNRKAFRLINILRRILWKK